MVGSYRDFFRQSTSTATPSPLSAIKLKKRSLAHFNAEIDIREALISKHLQIQYTISEGTLNLLVSITSLMKFIFIFINQVPLQEPHIEHFHHTVSILSR